MQKIILIAFLQIYCAVIFAQTNIRATIVPKNAPFEWGKISQADLDMKIYPLDSSADAVVLNDQGLVSDEIDNASSYFKRHRRLKLLKKSSADNEGVFKIIFHSQQESLLSVHAQIIQTDGRIRVLKESDFGEEKYNANYTIKKIIFPELKEGTITEIEYELASNYYFPINDWYFQYTIPVRKSDLTLKLFKNDKTIIGRVGSFRVRVDKTKIIDSKFEIKHFYADSVPAIKPNNFLPSINDYLTHFYFQINSYGFTGIDERNIREAWEGFMGHLITDTYFGLYTFHIKTGDAWRDIKGSIKPMLSDEQKMEAILNFVRTKIDWNGGEDIYPKESLNKVYEEKKGDCADINILLTSLLNDAGIKATPVLISTRSNGKPIENIPVTNQFNYVICLAEIDTSKFLLDASDPFFSKDLIRVDALNGRGFVADKKNPHWIDIVPQAGTTQRVLNLELDKNLQASGNLTASHKGYEAVINRRIGAKKEEADKKMKELLAAAGVDVKIENISDENLKNLNEPYKTTVNFKIADAVNTTGDISYLTPTLNLFEYNKSPFKEKERKYPIDFPYPERQNFSGTIVIPENLIVSDLPKSLKLGLPNNDATFLYSVSNIGDQIVCNVKLAINQLHFEATDYKALKDFFDQVAAKLNEQIVLKKK